MCFLFCSAQSSKKKEAVITENKSSKEVATSVPVELMEKAALSSSQPQPQLQPQPQSSPKHSESRRSSAKEGAVDKCSLNKASTKSVRKPEGGADTATKTVVVLKDEQKPQPSKNKWTVDDEETAPGGKGDHAPLISGKGPEVQPKNEATILDRGQEQIPGDAVDAASHTSKLEVRNGSLLESHQPSNSLDFIWTFGNCRMCF